MKKIPLTHGKFALVDDEDFERLNQYKWCVNAQGYVIRRVYTGTGKNNNTGYIIRMHRDVMKAAKGVKVDHKKGNKLDNRKDKLRFCNNAENLQNRGKQSNNTSGFKGVSKMTKNSGGYLLKNPWVAKITVSGKQISLGMYPTAREAAKAYKTAALKYHGEFACV